MSDSNNDNPFLKMFQDFGNSMNIPGADMSVMMDAHQKNLKALQDAVAVGSASAQSVMEQQRATLEKTLEDISTTVQASAKAQDPSAMMSDAAELAKRTFDATVASTTEITDTLRQGNTEAFDVLKTRVMESMDDLAPEKKS